MEGMKIDRAVDMITPVAGRGAGAGTKESPLAMFV